MTIKPIPSELSQTKFLNLFGGVFEKSNWIGPMWWDEVISDRTIGIQFLIALSKKFFGNSLFVIYIPSIFAAVLMIYCTYQLHKELIKDKYPIYSSLILSTTFLWINYAHMATQDIGDFAQQAFGINIYENNKETLPESEEELSIHMQLNYKQNIELAEEQAINTLLNGNNYEAITKRFFSLLFIKISALIILDNAFLSSLFLHARC